MWEEVFSLEASAFIYICACGSKKKEKEKKNLQEDQSERSLYHSIGGK